MPGTLEIFGSAVAADNDVLLRVTDLPVNEFGLFVTSLASAPAGTATFGNGYICFNTSVGMGRFFMANQIKHSGANGVITLDTNASEWSVTAIPTSTGSYAAMAGTRSYFQAWHREQVGAGFNFSGAASVTWQ